MQVETPNSEAAILARLIQAKEHMSRDVADYLLSIDFSQEDIDRMNFLRNKPGKVCSRQKSPQSWIATCTSATC